MGRAANLMELLRNTRELMVTWMPGRMGYSLRYNYWRKRLKHCGSNVKIDVGAYFQNPANISLHDGCWIDKYVMILAGPDNSERPRTRIDNPNFTAAPGEVSIGKRTHIAAYNYMLGIGGIQIGDDCGIAERVTHLSFTNHARDEANPGDRSFVTTPRAPHDQQFVIEGPIVLGNNVGVAVGAVLLPGITIGDDSAILVHALVKDSMPPNTFAGGHPYAKPIKERFYDAAAAAGATNEA